MDAVGMGATLRLFRSPVARTRALSASQSYMSPGGTPQRSNCKRPSLAGLPAKVS